MCVGGGPWPNDNIGDFFGLEIIYGGSTPPSDLTLNDTERSQYAWLEICTYPRKCVGWRGFPLSERSSCYDYNRAALIKKSSSHIVINGTMEYHIYIKHLNGNDNTLTFHLPSAHELVWYVFPSKGPSLVCEEADQWMETETAILKKWRNSRYIYIIVVKFLQCMKLVY